jgi:hypothetical protein
VQIIGANIGSFAKPLGPYLWDIQMVVWTKQFILYIFPGQEIVHTCSKNSMACNFFHTDIPKPPPIQQRLLCQPLKMTIN